MVKTSNKRSTRKTDNQAAVTAMFKAETPADADVEAVSGSPQATEDAQSNATSVIADEGAMHPPEETSKVATAISNAGASSAPKPSTKLEIVVAMLRRENGATVTEMTAATHWQAHSVRGFLSGTLKKKLGLALDKTKAADGELTYRILAEPANTEPKREAAAGDPENALAAHSASNEELTEGSNGSEPAAETEPVNDASDPASSEDPAPDPTAENTTSSATDAKLEA